MTINLYVSQTNINMKRINHKTYIKQNIVSVNNSIQSLVIETHNNCENVNTYRKLRNYIYICTFIHKHTTDINLSTHSAIVHYTILTISPKWAFARHHASNIKTPKTKPGLFINRSNIIYSKHI